MQIKITEKQRHLILDATVVAIGLVLAVYQMLEIHNLISLLLVVWVILRTPSYKILATIAVILFTFSSLFLLVKRGDASASSAIIGFYALFLSLVSLLFQRKKLGIHEKR